MYREPKAIAAINPQRARKSKAYQQARTIWRYMMNTAAGALVIISAANLYMGHYGTGDPWACLIRAIYTGVTGFLAYEASDKMPRWWPETYQQATEPEV